jgi:hypothetical protein
MEKIDWQSHTLVPTLTHALIPPPWAFSIVHTFLSPPIAERIRTHDSIPLTLQYLLLSWWTVTNTQVNVYWKFWSSMNPNKSERMVLPPYYTLPYTTPIYNLHHKAGFEPFTQAYWPSYTWYSVGALLLSL